MVHREIRRNLLPPVLLALVATLAGTINSAAAEGPTLRSLQMERHERLDERKLAAPGVRSSHVGWEVRSRHFVVVSTQSAEQASQTAAQMEQAWTDVARLADRWTTVHRQPSFGVAAVAVLLTNGNRFTSGGPAAGPSPTTDGAVLVVNLADRPWVEQLPALRREVCGAFLRVAQEDALLPAWSHQGLSDYLAEAEPPKVAWTQLPPPPANRPTWSAEELQRAQLWGHFLLEGNDAQYAPEFLAALGATVTARSRALASQAMHQPAGMSEPSEANSPLAVLVAKASREGDVGAWLRDPAVGQPVMCPEPKDLPLEARHYELALLLKLARRLSISGHSATQPMWTVADLQRRVNMPSAAAWATLDIDGRLLFSDDRERFGALLAPADRRYQTRRAEDGTEILQASFADGQRLEAWLEDNPDNPKRPLVHLRASASSGRRAEAAEAAEAAESPESPTLIR